MLHRNRPLILQNLFCYLIKANKFLIIVLAITDLTKPTDGIES